MLPAPKIIILEFGLKLICSNPLRQHASGSAKGLYHNLSFFGDEMWSFL